MLLPPILIILACSLMVITSLYIMYHQMIAKPEDKQCKEYYRNKYRAHKKLSKRLNADSFTGEKINL